VAAVVIVGVEPSREFGVAAVEPGVGPFIGQGAVESLDLAVGLRPIGACAPMLDVTQGVTKGMRSITRSVVSQYVSHREAALAEICVGAQPERRGGLFAFIRQQFGVGQPRVGVDRGMQEVISPHGIVMLADHP